MIRVNDVTPTPVLLDGENLFFGQGDLAQSEQSWHAMWFGDWVDEQCPEENDGALKLLNGRHARRIWGKRDRNIDAVVRELESQYRFAFVEVPWGKDAADHALVREGRSILDYEPPAPMIIGSGDHSVLDLVQQARELGLHTTLVVRSGPSCSRQLQVEKRRHRRGLGKFTLVSLATILNQAAARRNPWAQDFQAQELAEEASAPVASSPESRIRDYETVDVLESILSVLRTTGPIGATAPLGCAIPGGPLRDAAERVVRFGGFGRTRWIMALPRIADGEPESAQPGEPVTAVTAAVQIQECRIAIAIEDLLDELPDKPPTPEEVPWCVAYHTAHNRLLTVRAQFEAVMRRLALALPPRAFERSRTLDDLRAGLARLAPVSSPGHTALVAMIAHGFRGDDTDAALARDSVWVAHVLATVREDGQPQSWKAFSTRDLVLACATVGSPPADAQRLVGRVEALLGPDIGAPTPPGTQQVV